MKKVLKVIPLFVLLLVSSLSWAQNKIIKGRVIGDRGEGVANASVIVKSTTIGTTSNENGEFSISVPATAKRLLITSVGYESKEVAITDGPLEISLSKKEAKLDEVVIVGYGTQKKSVVTGAISKVKASDLENMPVIRIEQSLQGRTSGLTIASGSGQPGTSSTVRIRGTTSINNSDPLYVVDGVPVDVGGIDYLNQSDIESVEVLKDAASAAIYGTKAASGVILITTKKGKAGGVKLNYNAWYGTQAPANKLKLLNATEYATLRNESSIAAGGPILFPNPQSLGVGTDWQSLIFNNSAKIQNHELNFSGGNDKSTFYASFGYFNQDGIVASAVSNYKRFTIRFNSAHKITKYLNFGNNISYSNIKNQSGFSENGTFGGPLTSAINLDPITKSVITDPLIIASPPYSTQPIIRDVNGNPYGISSIVGQEMSNPLAYVETQKGNYGWSHNIVGNAYLEVTPVKGLTFRTSIGAKQAFWGGESFTPIYFLSPTQSNLNNTSFNRNSSKGFNWNWDNTIAYSRRKGSHNFTALVGTNAQESSSSGLFGQYIGIPANSFAQASMNYSVAAVNRLASGYEAQPYRLASYFGRLTYDYQEKYLFTGIFRRDGSSRFGGNNKYANFPSVSVGWIPSKENFWPANKVISFLKIRGSYGITGNDNFANFQYVSTVSDGRNYSFANNIYIGNSPNAPANPNLKWERTTQTNVGFEATFSENITVNFDWYKKNTTGMLLPVVLPSFVGAEGNPFGNIADMENRGVELEMGYKRKFGDVNFEIQGNISHLKNKVIFLGDDKEFLTGQYIQTGVYEISRIAVGQPIGAFYGFQTLGIFQTQEEVDNYKDKLGVIIQPNAKPGDFKYADLDGDGQIGANDRTFIGDPTPTLTYGFTVSASYKGFDMVVFGQGVAGNDIYDALRRLDILTANYTTKALSRWTGPGTSNDFPRLIDTDPNKNFGNPSTFQLSDGSYFRIKTLQIGYTFSKKLLGKTGIDKARIYLSGNNLLTLTNYTGYDPEIGGGSYGVDKGVYPQARSFMIGVNITL